jgi:hypothetical protein
MRPGGQIVHSGVVNVSAKKPGVQSVHVVLVKKALWRPGAHDVQPNEPSPVKLLILPMAHGSHTALRATGENQPGAHCTHVLCASAMANSPLGQLVHEIEPVVRFERVPSGHGTQLAKPLFGV